MRLTIRGSLVITSAALLAYGGSVANADFAPLLPAEQFAVLGQFSNNQTNFNNGTITGDVGIGTPREFTISNASVVGNIRFSGAASTAGINELPGNPSTMTGPGPFTVSGGGTVSGGVVANDMGVTNALNAANSYSQTLGGESGTALTLTSTQTINASAGILDAGNRIFTTSSVNLSNSTTLTINGSATDFVVINVTDNNPAFNGKIVLTGGITSDHVLFNMFGGDYTAHTGGPTLTVSTNGVITTGVFLDPNGGMQINHSVLDGRFWGGDTTNQQIVSGADINAPGGGGFGSQTPEPSELISLAAMSLVGIGGMFFFRRRAKSA
jgi:hypothetical protein